MQHLQGHADYQMDSLHTNLAPTPARFRACRRGHIGSPFWILLPTEGQILVGGRNVSVLPKHKIPEFRRTLGVVFQDFKLLKLKTILENVGFVLRVLGVPEEDRKRRAFLALRSVGLEDKLDAFPLQLSGGEQQRVAIARALINEPELVLADEPTGNLDPERAAEVMALFEEMCATKGTTVLVATHDREMIERMGKRVITLVKGQVAEG